MVCTAGQAKLPPVMDWQDNQSYLWIASMPRRAIAWEFMRRSPRYHAACAIRPSVGDPEPSDWPMVRLEDPALDARQAAPAWTRSVCDEILPVISGGPAMKALHAALPVSRLSCRMRTIQDRDITHVIFSDQGRQLQLEMHDCPNVGTGIFTPAVAPAAVAAKRTLALRRLADLAEHGVLRQELYPAEARAPRLARVLQALDGAMTGARHRDIAVSLFGERRVLQDWGLPDNHLRDHVRRAIAHGRMLMTGGFSRLLG